VVNPARQERNYNVFYQVTHQTNCSAFFWLTGCARLRSFLSVQVCAHAGAAYKPSDFRYLAVSECFTIHHVDDKFRFTKVLDALRTLGVSDGEREAVFDVVKAILHLGNVEFEEVGERLRVSS
jgi:myosin heavy subunit